MLLHVRRENRGNAPPPPLRTPPGTGHAACAQPSLLALPLALSAPPSLARAHVRSRRVPPDHSEDHRPMWCHITARCGTSGR